MLFGDKTSEICKFSEFSILDASVKICGDGYIKRNQARSQKND
jgi:hypothetical protein